MRLLVGLSPLRLLMIYYLILQEIVKVLLEVMLMLMELMLLLEEVVVM